MENNYKIKYKNGNVEFEIESTDKMFVEERLKDLLGTNIKPAAPKQQPAKKAKTIIKDEHQTLEGESTLSVMAVYNSIIDSDQHNIIEDKILNKSNNLHKILLIAYHANIINSGEYFTTSFIQDVTDQLGIKIATRNVASKMKSENKYFTVENLRKQGAAVNYKINRKGIQEFEKIING